MAAFALPIGASAGELPVCIVPQMRVKLTVGTFLRAHRLIFATYGFK
jgi:hypothetical protein